MSVGAHLARDLRFAGRMLRKSPRFTITAVATLALGIGLNTSVFSAVYALMVRPVSGVAAPDRIVQLFRSTPEDRYGSNSIPHYRDVRERGQDTFDGVAAWTLAGAGLDTGEGADVAMVQMASSDYFAVLGVEAELGRTFRPGEADEAGRSPVVVLSHAGWRSRFGGDPDVVGRTVRMNGVPVEVIGVAPADFKGMWDWMSPTLWAPLAMHPLLEPGLPAPDEDRSLDFLFMVARMRGGAGIEATRAGVERIVAGLREDHPADYANSTIYVMPQSEAGIVPQLGSAQVGLSAVLMAVVGLLLLICCLNVANLFLARSEQRKREIAVRVSLGAGRGAIARQLLTESLLFAAVSGAIGLALATWLVRAMNEVPMPVDVPVDFGFAINTPVLLFTMVATLGAGIVFGLAPALHAARRDTADDIKGGDRGGARAGVLPKALVVIQMAVSVVLLVTSALFLRNLQAATTMDLGFTAEGILDATPFADVLGYDEPTVTAYYRELLERVEAEPGVLSAAMADDIPLQAAGLTQPVAVPGYQPGPDESMEVWGNRVSPGYFETLRIDLRGRDFTDADDGTAPGVAIVNRAFAERFWPGEEALGRTVVADGRERIVVGVTPTGKYRSLGEAPRPFVYFPFSEAGTRTGTIHVRTAGDPTGFAARIREISNEIDAAVTVRDISPMEDQLGYALLPSRVAALALGVFGLLGVLLSAIGTYGVVGQAVSRRTREIGIRMALGADRAGVLGMVVSGGLRLTAVGLGSGLALAFGAATAIRSLLYTGRAIDPVVFVGVPLVLGMTALLATWIPARRAAGADPLVALKAD